MKYAQDIGIKNSVSKTYMRYSNPLRLSLVTISALLATAIPYAAKAEVTCNIENENIVATTPTRQFTLRDDGTATDNRTGLMWMRCVLGQTWSNGTCEGTTLGYSWFSALDETRSINAAGGIAGFTDWRLPTKNELLSIVEARCAIPAMNYEIFPAFSSDWFAWSSSPGHSDRSLVLNPRYGEITQSSRFNRSSVLLVRIVN